MREPIRYTVGAAIALLLTATLSAQGNKPQTEGNQGAKGDQSSQSGGGNVSANDRTFLMTAGQGGMAEVELGNLASQKATNDEVKSLAQHIVKDHTANNKELKTVASAKGVAIPSTLDAEHRQVEAKLEKLEGASFDKAFASAMVDDHKKMIALFEQASKSNDAQIKAYAEKTLPALREHLQHAQKAQAALGGAASTSGNAPASSPSSSPGGNPK